MKNRIDRRGDASLYQPKIASERVRSLYALKQQTGKPMTVLLDQAIRDLTEKYRIEKTTGELPALERVEPETWEEILEYRRLLDEMDYLVCLEEIKSIKNNG